MSETQRERVSEFLRVRDGTIPASAEEAIRALLDLVRVQYEANEEMTRLLKAAEAERDALKLKRREQFNRWGVQIRYEDQEQSLLAVMQLVAERDALRVEVERERKERISAESGCEAGTAARYVVEAERDTLTEKLSLVTEDYISHRNALERAEAALREIEKATEGIPEQNCAIANRIARAALRDTAPEDRSTAPWDAWRNAEARVRELEALIVACDVEDGGFLPHAFEAEARRIRERKAKPRLSTEDEARAAMGDGQALTKLREIKP